MNHRLPWVIELHIDADVLARLIQDGKLVVDENGFIAGEGRKGGSSYANVQNALRVESRYELEFARHLISSGRLFTKPMRYDANEDVIFPDFILHDATSTHDLPIEVWGRNDQAYVERRERKVAYLREAFGDNWTAWDAIAGKPFPELPQQRNVVHFTRWGKQPRGPILLATNAE